MADQTPTDTHAEPLSALTDTHAEPLSALTDTHAEPISALTDAQAAAAASLSELRIQPAQAIAGQAPPPLGTVALSGPAPAGGLLVQLASDHPERAAVPASITVPENAAVAFFEVALAPSGRPETVTITATAAGTARSATLSCLPAGPSTRPSDDADRPRPCPQSFRAALLAVIPAFPILATIASAAIYISPPGTPLLALVPLAKANPLLLGTILALGACLVVAGLCYGVFHLTSADQANASGYAQLCQRLRELDVRIRMISRCGDLSSSEQTALHRAWTCADLVRIELAKGGARWILGTGYINLWSLVHRAEESLLLVEPADDVVAAALYDELRLSGAQIDNAGDLLTKLRVAVLRLRPLAGVFLNQQPPAGAPTGAAATPAASPSPADEAIVVQGARAALRDVRQAINEFRDASWDALVRTRNHLMGTLTVTGWATFLLLWIALSGRGGDAPKDLLTDPIAAAATLYLIGGVVGLFNRLYQESGSDNAVEDYGLTVARMSLTPVLSGLAALGGVLIVAMVPATFSGQLFSPGATATSSVPALDAIFNLRANPVGMLLAGVFGLTPSLLIGALQSTADRYRDGIKSTAAPSPTKS